MKHPFTVFGILCSLMLTNSVVRSAGQANAPDKTDWLKRLNAIEPGDWSTARGEVNRLAGLPRGVAAVFIAELWPALKDDVVKSQLLQAMFNAKHPDALRIARIAMADKSAYVSSAIRGILSNDLGVSTDWDKTKAWIDAHQDQSYAEVRRDQVTEVIRQLWNIGKLTQLGRDLLLQHAAQILRCTDLHETAVQNGLFDAARYILYDPSEAPSVRVSILSILADFAPTETYLRETVWPLVHASDKQVRRQALVTLAKSRYRPAYSEIKSALKGELGEEWPQYYQLATALASYGNPDAIPFLIGIIAADNNEAIYNVEYFALGPLLTGSPFAWTHDGNWWRIWWEHNRGKLPIGLRDLPIPNFAHSRSYKEPMPREYHLDRSLMCNALLRKFTTAAQQGQDAGTLFQIAQELDELCDPAVIPTFIGAIAADNTLDTIYRFGNSLYWLTGVPYSILHDGTWWTLWWDAHRNELPEVIRNRPIPSFPHTNGYREPISQAAHGSAIAICAELIQRLRNSLNGAASAEFFGLCQALNKLEDPGVVPDIIALIPENPNDYRITSLTYGVFETLTGVKYVPGRGREWWQRWWQQNGSEFKKRVTDVTKQPDFITAVYKPNPEKIVPLVTEVGYNPVVLPNGAATRPDPDLDAADIKGIVSDRYYANGDQNKLYRLVGLSKDKPIPRAGYKMLLVLPGGDGSEDFRWFIRRMKKYALPVDVLVAELVAPKWSEWQAKNLVWPSSMSPFFGMKFTTEEFINDVIEDVRKKTRLDPVNICTLAWSSSGPAVYTYSATAKAHVRGAFIAMSVFRPSELPDPASVKGRRFFVYHSPEDFIPIQQANEAVDFLKAHGASVKMQEYEGGHGWTYSVYRDIQQGVAWLFSGN